MTRNLDSANIENIFIPDSKNESESALIQQCFDLVNVFVVAIDLDSNITLINKKGCEILGLKNEKLVGQNFVGHFITKDKQTKVQAFLNTILKSKSKQTNNIKYHLQTANNETKIIEARNIPIRDKENNILGILITGDDLTSYVPDNKTYSGIANTQNITDDKRTEQTLKRAKETAEKANRAKSDFLARVSHEIRTPLNAILGFTEQLKQTQLNSKQTDYVEIIDKSSEHLLSLINDILILSKIEARQINFEKSPFKIKYNVKYVHNALLNKAKEKGLNFSYDIDPKLDMVVLGDSFRLRQILINMLSNAIKFTSAGYVELRCFLIHQNKNKIKVRFDIIDTGIGIKPENLQSIFEQFKQADSSITQKYGGTGLGLTICKNLIDMQNGSLSVSSQENIGTTFSFVIPYEKGAETDIASGDLGEIDPYKLKNKSVLFVDDDSVNRLLGKTILEKIKCDYDIANSGKEAIVKLDAKKYDIVLLDIHMPDISGIDVAKYLRQQKNNKSTKIVAVTAAVMKDDIQKYYKAGINDFLIKPFKEIHLFNKMCEVLQLKQTTYPKATAEIILKEEIHPKLYNLSELKKMSGNKPELIANMLTTFIENSEQALQKFNEALADNDNEQIAETAHKILPSYRHLEVNYIVNKLIELKNTSQNSNDFKMVEKETKSTIQSILKLIDELQNELQNLHKSNS